MKLQSRFRAGALCLAVLCGLTGAGLSGATDLANQPVFSTSNVPGNLALALSVEWPTASRTAHTDNYSSSATFLGYFDPNKCYRYVVDTTPNGVSTLDKGDSSYFQPAGLATNRACTGTSSSLFSGNFLNWAATATIDPFRWAMTGGRRVVDTATTTILEKGWHSGQGLFDDRDLPVSEISGATPFIGASRVGVSVNGRGFKMRLSTVGSRARTLAAAYYSNSTTFSGTPVLVANDNADHTWGGSAPVPGVSADNFSARFTGTFTAPEAGNYVFRTVSDDGIRLWVDTTGNNAFSDANRRINNYDDHGSETDDTAAINMTAGQSFSIRIDYYERGGDAVMQLLWRRPSTSTFALFNDDSGNTDYTMRTKVCDSSPAAGGLESNCVQYGANAKPEGLIQQYNRQIRFSAFGYLNDTSDQRDGGVLRAQQKFVGPTQPVPGLPDITNSEQEWSSIDGTFFRNPNGTDASTTTSATGVTVSDSGVINYLNKFGQLIPGNYKDFDPVSELYYAALRYYKNLGNISAWSTMGTNDNALKQRYVDGFPVITNWRDPIQYYCQRNFILGIGDIYTHVDKNVPGNTAYRTREPTAPNFTGETMNAVTATNQMGALQSLGDIGNTDNYSGRNNSAYIAGMAYSANVTDIRPDAPGQVVTIGKQTVQTYWVDVLEQSFQANNQFYLAAKFGGMTVPDSFNPATATPATIQKLWWATTNETLTDVRSNTVQPRPDNYFTAGRPDTMVDGLRRAFASISRNLSAFTTALSLSTPQVASEGSASFSSQYNANGWTSTLSATRVTIDGQGVPTSTAVWNSGGAFETQMAGNGWDTGRRVVTWNGTARAGIAFRSTALSTAQLANLDTPWATGNDVGNFVNYLRGDRTNERISDADASKPYRHRNVLLGDIVNSKLTAVGAPNFAFSDSVNPGYAKFKSDYSNRQPMVYMGANDGMMHAFNGSLDGADAGKEQFAYVPSAVFAGPSGTPSADGLAQLGNPNYQHRYYVDATPVSFDIDFNNAGGTFTSTSAATSDWRSVLIGGLGKGGKSFYAIDITNPGATTDENIVKTKVLWEFTDATMGFSFGAPLVLKTARYGWVVVLTSGYNNSDGYGYIYIVNPRDGTLLQKIRTGTTSNGLTQATAFVKDFTDGVADAVYAGDLDGQMWRFDLTAAKGTTTAYPAPLRLATATSAAGVAQPITTQPLVEISPGNRKRYVTFGTGQLLDTVDVNSSSEQTFYAIVDGTANVFGTTADLPTGITYPINRNELTEVTNATLVSNTAIDFSGKAGWRLDLGTSTNGSTTTGWRVVINPTAFNGVVAFSSLLTSGDACSPTGQSRVYAVDFGQGKSLLIGAPAGYNAYDNAINDLKFVGVGKTARLIAGDVEGAIKRVAISPTTAPSLRLLNWREIPTVD